MWVGEGAQGEGMTEHRSLLMPCWRVISIRPLWDRHRSKQRSVILKKCRMGGRKASCTGRRRDLPSRTVDWIALSKQLRLSMESRVIWSPDAIPRAILDLEAGKC